ncbi:MAG: hypothetical protein NVS3B16_14200 [Vulcanimicrobiaceae bacterium]
MPSIFRLITSLAVAIALAAPLAEPASAAVAPEYRIRPGDVLELTVFGEPTLSQPVLKVLPSGTIVEPLAGQVKVGGLTPPQASAAVERALARYLRHPKVAVAVSLVGPLDVYVLGNVRTPGKYQLQPDSRLMDALAAAGGLGPVDGDLPAARISSGSTVSEVPLQRLLHQGDLSLNRPVENQMTVYVPSPITFNIQVFGAVDKPGDVVMHEGDRLLMAIARAGNSPNVNSDLNHIVLRHPQTDGSIGTQTINLYDVYKSGDSKLDPVLQKGDSVYVPQGRGKRDNVSPLAGVLFGLRRLVGLP